MKEERGKISHLNQFREGGVAVPTASGAFGEWYQCWMSDEEIEKVQALALELCEKGKLKVHLKTSPEGEQYVPKYALTKYALLALAARNNGEKARRKNSVRRCKTQ